ncbi:MAG TPA: undecaprenyldiphospho-muramoylpentapeptide beta-N-acetylglucosaminyltransferase [Terriglobales bacterium]|nr:undecaprenyldiphospho-muramoylpentapeptide beta-N-acetylglucosaminyltransferase [Terriglobales bacterium]
MRAVLAGGGTGGHVIPALAIAQELRQRYAANILFIGTARGIENRLVPAANFPLQLIRVGALNRVSLATRVQTLLLLPNAILQARRMLGEFQAEVVISVGGYASGPTMVGAALGGRPVLIFEPNYVPGFANHLGSRMAAAAAIQFIETGRHFRNARVTGIPVRQAFFHVPARPANGKPTLLVFGGSQGAHAINEAVWGALPGLARRLPGLTIIHQTGERDYNEAQARYQQAGMAAEVFRFIDNMPEAFGRADLLICRSGASTVAEVAAAAKAAIFVPLPTAADDHQRRNAEALAKAGAAQLLLQSDLTPGRLTDTVAALLGDRAQLARMSEAAKKLAHPDAAKEIAEMAAELAARRRKS